CRSALRFRYGNPPRFIESPCSDDALGDVNHGGVCVSDRATVRLIDCDSFQVTIGARRFLCEMGVPTFTPPELQGRPFRGVVRTPNHDNFGLAILIFHLLFMGRHPFAGRFLGQGDMSIEKAIAEFRFAYGAARGAFQMEPPPNTPSMGIASHDVASLLERAFSPNGTREGARPEAKEWISSLDALERQLKTCHVNPSHIYADGLDHCPWCRLEAATGAVLFSFVVRSAPSMGVDMGAVWTRIAAVARPGSAPPLPDWSTVSPSPEAETARSQRRGRRSWILGGYLTFVIVLCLAFPVGTIIWLLGALRLWPWANGLLSKNQEDAKYRDAVRLAEDRYGTLKSRWDQDASDQRFITHLRQLEHAREQLQELPNVRRRRYQELERARESDQRRRHLESVRIEDATIPGIGPGRKAMLASYNIETAWDLNEKQISRVPGFGPVLTRDLMAWRKAVETKFRFDPSKGVDPRDIAALDREIADNKQALERDLANGPQALTQIRDHILAQRTALQPLINEAGMALAQAKTNLKVACG
ncbi:hypothetical protein, partial [Methylosinus sp. Ce-a6]|uniref:hypothetical protein n=1 Tax=Methylosinus sp. Ce-a6 TaxID=2172005 RepID=UPI001AED2E49